MLEQRRHEKSGIYAIEKRADGKFYIGSSQAIYKRWYEHRARLRLGTHHSPHLQAAWNKHGEDAFDFYVLEECAVADLLTREQVYLDAFHPAFNICTTAGRVSGPDLDARRAATLRAKAALITRCPQGHPYDDVNTYVNKKNKRICKRCNADRVNRLVAVESSVEREARLLRMKENHQAKRAERLAAMRAYTLAHKAEKRAYDRARRLGGIGK